MSRDLDRLLEPVAAHRRERGGYEVLALRYGTCTTTRSRCFLGYERYGEADAPAQMDFFLWVLRDAQRTIVIDTGFDPEVASRRGRHCLLEPLHALGLAGVALEHVEQVVLTHLHYDHAGNLAAFPRAALHVHERELAFWRGPFAARGQFAGLVEPSELDALGDAEREGRVRPIQRDGQLAPGVVAMWTGGHTPGQIVLAVAGRSEIVVLASDAMHFYEELERDMPFAVLSDLPEMYAGYDLLGELQARGARILAGHDPAVLVRFPALTGVLAGNAVVVA